MSAACPAIQLARSPPIIHHHVPETLAPGKSNEREKKVQAVAFHGHIRSDLVSAPVAKRSRRPQDALNESKIKIEKPQVGADLSVCMPGVLNLAPSLPPSHPQFLSKGCNLLALQRQ